MPLKYLTDQKLRYFWSKVKDILANKSEKGHKHTKSEITDFAHTHAFPVTKVNGKTGDIVLSYSDVQAAAANHSHPSSITNSGWVRLTMSTNFLTSGAPWVNQMKRYGDVVTLEADLTLKYNLATTRDYLVFYKIPTQFKPGTLWKSYFYSEQHKRYYLEMSQDATYGLQIKIRPIDSISANDRIRIVLTYMI